MPEGMFQGQTPAGALLPSGDFLDPQKIISQLDFTSDMRIADFGSGSGFFAISVAEALGNTGVVTAVDILENALESVRMKAGNLRLSNVQTIRGNLEVLGASGLADATQDIVFIHNMLFQNDKKEEILREARRALKNGGKLVVIDWVKDGGGLGPPDHLRTSKETVMSMASQLGLALEKQIDAGKYHFGLLFRKT